VTGHYLKWTRGGRIPSYQGGPPIPLGRWTEAVPSPVLCERGWHACRWEDAVHHISEELYVCDLDGVIVAGNDKVAGERLRLVKRVLLDDVALRLFAADCAERVLPVFLKVRPDDDRPAQAIQAARQFAHGEITAAAGAAAGAAARAAAWDAAGDAGRAAAGAAAGAAAWAAAGDWQSDRLLTHYAALSAADFARRPLVERRGA
jgi:hypothetical protein